MTQAPDWNAEAVLFFKGMWASCARTGTDIESVENLATALRTAYTRGRVEGLREAAAKVGDWVEVGMGFPVYDSMDSLANEKVAEYLNALADEIEREGRE